MVYSFSDFSSIINIVYCQYKDSSHGSKADETVFISLTSENGKK